MANTIRGRNEGSLFKQPNGNWRAQVSIEGQRLSKVAKTKQECQTWLKAMTRQVDAGLTFSGARMTLGEFLEDWLRTVKQNRRPKTHLSYRRLADRYILPKFGSLLLREMQPHRIEQYLTWLQEQGVGDRTCQIIYATLHASLQSALRKGILGRNPMDAVEKPKVKHPRRIVTLQTEQVQQLLIAASGHPHEALYHHRAARGRDSGAEMERCRLGAGVAARAAPGAAGGWSRAGLLRT
jgi:hypothetical protein